MSRSAADNRDTAIQLVPIMSQAIVSELPA